MDHNTLADDEPRVEAQRAKGLRQPRKPTPQQAHEHELIGVQSAYREEDGKTNYKTQRARQPVIQVDFAFIKTNQEPRPTAVLTAVDVTTQLCMPCLVPDKSSMMDYMINNLQAFILECGRTNGILQSDNEGTLNALLKATAAKLGSMTARHSPAYSGNNQGSVERLRRTLLGQMRTFNRKSNATTGSHST